MNDVNELSLYICVQTDWEPGFGLQDVCESCDPE